MGDRQLGLRRAQLAEVLDHLSARRFVLDDYVTHTFPLARIEEAFATRASDLEHSFKVVVPTTETARRGRAMFSTLAPTALPLRVSFARQLELASANGFEALDLPLAGLLKLSRSVSAEQIRERFSEHGLRCGGWQLPFDYQADREDFSADLRRLDRAAADLRASLAARGATTGSSHARTS